MSLFVFDLYCKIISTDRKLKLKNGKGGQQCKVELFFKFLIVVLHFTPIKLWQM